MAPIWAAYSEALLGLCFANAPIAIGGGNHVAPENLCPTPSSISAATNRGIFAQFCTCCERCASSPALPPKKITPPTPRSSMKYWSLAAGGSQAGY